MIFRLLNKFKKSIILLIVLCITIPLIGACGEAENKLQSSKSNKVIGVGGSIEAYTTYSQAKFLEMDKQMYHSYLMGYRDFILVVLPEGKDSENNPTGYPDTSNLMFQAAYNGVTPYAEQVIDGNFTFKNPEYKLLIYYVLAKDFLSWENQANEEVDKSFIGSALDFLGPSDLDNYEGVGVNKEANVIKNEEEYNLKNVVNKNSYVSECDFLRVTKNSSNKYEIASYKDVSNTTALTKCGADGYIPKGKNVIADVANGGSTGVTLLFSEGGLTGYFTDKHLEGYNFSNVGWISQLLSNHKGSMEEYISDTMKDTVCNKGSDLIKCEDANIREYAKQMSYKFKYDLSLLGRIRKINYNTLFDINTTSTNITSVNNVTNIDEYSRVLKGDLNKNEGTYIAFTTADGFIMDRGNILMQSGVDLVFNTDFLESLTQMDACTNRTLGGYVAEVLANIGLVVGGIAVGVGAAATVAGTLAAIGAGSLTVPGIGWIVGGALLLIAGAAALYYSVTTKKAIDETNSANFCDVYKEIIQEIINMSSVKIPIYHYNIESTNGETVELCYEQYYDIEVDGKKTQKCGTKDSSGNFKEAATIPAFKMANQDDVKKLGSLSGAPSIRLYSGGKLVDEIYGASSTQYIYSVLDSWGVTAAANMKYYITKDTEASNEMSIYNLLGEGSTINSSSYCFSLEYGRPCNSAIPTTLNFNDGKAKLNVDQTTYNNFVNSLKEQLKNPGESEGRKSHQQILSEINEKKNQLTKISRYMEIPVTVHEDENENLTHKVSLNGKQFYINEILGAYSLTPADYSLGDSLIIPCIGGKCNYDGLTFYINNAYVDGHQSYKIELDVENELNVVINEINELINNKGSSKLEEFSATFKSYFSSNNSSINTLINSLVSDYIGDVVYYSEEIPVYVTVNISGTDAEGATYDSYISALMEKRLIELTLNG